MERGAAFDDRAAAGAASAAQRQRRRLSLQLTAPQHVAAAGSDEMGEASCCSPVRGIARRCSLGAWAA
ncbi:MAG: hypothetical protein MZV49_01835 [Rhodopseudomonas palustris]|nr:hypothetical protein [Rhodopseudomonas palustris]